MKNVDITTPEEIKSLDEIRSFLNEYEIDYTTEFDNFCLNYNNDKRKYEIEYVSSKNYPIAYPKFNIEGVNQDFFYNKSVEAEKNNSFKLWIKDFEWADENKKEVLKSYILHAVNKTPNKYNARDCYVDVIDTKEARAFETKNCFYGKRGASLNLGLRLKKDKNGLEKGTLLMLYTFGKNFFAKKENIIEIIRVGTLTFSQVIGGSSKLLTYFISNYKNIKIANKEMKVEYLKFYSDYDHNIGNSMDKLGFDFIGYSKGGFMNYWLETGEVKNRQPMKHKWVIEQMQLGKVLAIPNSGVKTYILDLNKNTD